MKLAGSLLAAFSCALKKVQAASINIYRTLIIDQYLNLYTVTSNNIMKSIVDAFANFNNVGFFLPRFECRITLNFSAV